MDFGEAKHLPELRIVLMGNRAAGKSSVGNIILGREEFDLKRSTRCVRRHGEVADRHITVIEAPGWWMNYAVEFSPEILKQEIVLSVSLCPPGPHVVLLIRVDDRFGETERKAIEAHVALLGERVWSHTIVVFTHGDSLSDSSIGRHIEIEGQDLQWLLDKCGNRYHVLNNQDRSDDDTQVKKLLEKIEEAVAQNNGSHFEVDRKNLQKIKQKSVKLAKLKSQLRSEDGDRRCSSARGVCDIRSQLIMESRKNHSLELPPSMSSHESSHRWSQRSCADSSFRPQIKAENEFGSSCSMASTVSSGYGSLSGLSECVENSEHKQKTNMSPSSELCEKRD